MFVVTGGGRGIGRELAIALAARGKSVLIIGRHEETLIQTAALSSFINYYCADVSSSVDQQNISDYLRAVPTIEGLIHNAGVIEPITPIEKIDRSLWQACMATNVDASLFLTQLLIEKMRGGRVLNIGSGAAHFPVTGWGAYCVSKAALSMLTRCWQQEYQQTAFACVMPGIIDTTMQETIRNADHMEFEKKYFFNQLKNSHKLIAPSTVAAFLCWLLLDIDKTTYASKEWDIYDTTHHHAWLIPPASVPALE